jgi:hypothetical protein
MSTTISKRSNGRYRTTLPRGLARDVGLEDRDDPKIRFGTRCADSSIALELTLGPAVDPSGMNVMSPTIHSTGQVEIELPRFTAEAWNLDGVEIDWPDGDEVEVDEDGNVTIVAPLVDWEPAYDVDMFTVSGGFAYGSTISKSGDTRTNVESHFPINPAEDVGLAESQQRAEITFDCVDGRKVMVATPTEKERSELRNSVSINLAGANKRQARFNAARIAAEFGVTDVLDAGESVRLRWFSQNDEHLVAFTRDNGGDN